LKNRSIIWKTVKILPSLNILDKRVNNDDEYIREINYLKENLEEKDTDLE